MRDDEVGNRGDEAWKRCLLRASSMATWPCRMAALESPNPFSRTLPDILKSVLLRELQSSE